MIKFKQSKQQCTLSIFFPIIVCMFILKMIKMELLICKINLLMKRIFFLLIPVFLFAEACSNSDNKLKPGIIAQMDFIETTFEFGTIQNGSEQKCSFEFKNTSQAPLKINNVIVSCGCTSPKWPKNLILPGESGKIEIVYHPAGAGFFRKSISIFSNAKNSPIHLYIRGEIKL